MYRCTNPDCGELVIDCRRGWARTLWKQRIARCPTCGSPLTPDHFVEVNKKANSDKYKEIKK
jgi:DNA-directed RNA polymerase subunit RPC12/RpoP